MQLEVKRPDYIVPSYSLTGDLLSYLRCRLQYRYHKRSALPESRPVQLWFGEFIHGTLEMAYRFWDETRQSGKPPPAFPWPCTLRCWGEGEPTWQQHDIGKFADSVEQALRRQGKQARSTDTRDSAYERVEVAVNELGPHLFPLIASAERKVIGTRPVAPGNVDLRCQNYQVHGVIDVLTHVTLMQGAKYNFIRERVQKECPDLSGTFEVIVDYKGTRRPLEEEPFWDQDGWQIQTYAWLRQQQPEAFTVAAGILLYVNELTPGTEEMRALRKGLQENTTDVRPAAGSRDEQIIRMWRPGMDASQLSLEFRLRRAIRVIAISKGSISTALYEFDKVVRKAEEDFVAESDNGNILQAWSPNCEDAATCAACDFRHFCPKPACVSANYQIMAPTAP